MSSGSGLASGTGSALVLMGRMALIRSAHGPRVAVVDPAQIVLRVIRVSEARELQLPAGERPVMVARDPLLARPEQADAEQLAVVGVGQVEIVAHEING